MSSIINATTTAGVTVQGDNSGSLQLATNNGTTAVTIDTSQNVGIGTSSPTAKLNVAIGSNTLTQNIVTIKGGGASGSFSGLSVQSNSGDEIFNVNNLTYNVTMGTVAGNLLVGTTSLTAGNARLTAKADGSGNSAISANSAGTSAYNIISIENGNGQVGRIQTNGSATSYLTSSDYRLKEDIQPMTGALAKVQALKPCTFNWKVDGTSGQGFIAHELQEVCPDAVGGEKDAVETYTDEEGNEQTRIKPQGVDTSFLVATLTAAIQELKAELDATKAEVQALKGTL